MNKFSFKSDLFNILIIEDKSSLVSIIKNIFNILRFKTFFTTNIEEARKIIDLEKIDYIILDIDLPDGDRYEFIQKLSSSQIKTVVLSDFELKEISYQKGIVDFIIKDKNLASKISEIPKLIKQLEKNKRKNILLVDDSYVNRSELRAILENRNYNILEAKSKNEALEIINLTKIDLILLDLDEDLDNYDFLVENKRLLFKELNIKVIFITENISSNLIRDAFRLGVKEIIKKPYLIEELVFKTNIFINEKNNEEKFLSKTQLLKQYKNTVDRSSIVSKADSNGIITYINEAFCDISGYTSDELLGKPHNIVRHPDMDSSIFEDMWHTIKDLKTPWKGIIKNKKKDGTAYWVQTIINPIIDNKGRIIEYIGIRVDITEVEETKEYLKSQYDITQNNFDEILNLSKLYENAIEQSNITLRVNNNRIITYADKEFYEISGYTKDELIGKPYSFLKRVNENNYQIEDMWKELSSGKIWKGQISNKFKDNKIHHFLVTIVPIINLSGEILEYMSIRKDITELIELHQDIERTQRDIIYKMGEIGETRSNETGNHVKRVAEYSKLLAILYGLDEKDCDILFVASPMHDIGKVGVPDSILNKPDKLNDEEWKIMRKHTITGYNILKNSKREILKAAAIVARDHHEKWDGTGYPQKISGEEIHIYGRITAIADVFDALGSDRCYKKAWRDEDIFTLLKEQRGKHFDPKLIDLFFGNLDRFMEIRSRYKD